ncbi:MAG: DUF4338 domain-containing protein, partial [Planctomycetes bacterium]|nr:DUF4338 domain-containing protein [Planctomycetota bacterium]
MGKQIPEKLCGRPLSAADMETIRREIPLADPPIRSEIARRVCRALDWTNALGQPKLMSCRVGLLRLHRSGLIELPAPTGANGNGRPLRHEPKQWPEEVPLDGSVGRLCRLRLSPVTDKQTSRLWNGLIDRYHYLGYTPLPGAQVRYLIEYDQGLLGALGFGAAAWKVAARDRWIGWEASVREAHLGRVLNNARFLLLPWVRVKNLASKVLALSASQVADDFAARYGERPVLLETFVEIPRFRGSCYRAANWQYLGETRGRGKGDRTHRAVLPRKGVYVHPLRA